jgi:hypothetical protein
VALQLTCKPEIAKAVSRMSEVEEQLSLLRARIAREGPSQWLGDVLDDLTAELGELEEKLTLTSRISITPELAASPKGSATAPTARDLSGTAAPASYSDWFLETGEALDRGLSQAKVPGRHGTIATITPDPQLFKLLSPGDGSSAPRGPTPYLYYRRPVPASVAVNWCSARPADGSCAAAELLKRENTNLPQLSGLFSIRIGRGGIFGTRQAAATFNADGAPLTLEYGSTTGGADIAAVIDSGKDAATSLRDAETAAITRRVAREKALKDLNDLLDEPVTD